MVFKQSLTQAPERASPAQDCEVKTQETHEKDATWGTPPTKELFILWAIRGTGKIGAYGLDIQRAVHHCSNGNESISIGTLYSLLKRLRNRGYVDSYEGDALGGGAKRQYYFLTEKGHGVLAVFDVFQSKLQQWTP